MVQVMVSRGTKICSRYPGVKYVARVVHHYRKHCQENPRVQDKYVRARYYWPRSQDTKVQNPFNWVEVDALKRTWVLEFVVDLMESCIKAWQVHTIVQVVKIHLCGKNNRGELSHKGSPRVWESCVEVQAAPPMQKWKIQQETDGIRQEYLARNSLQDLTHLRSCQILGLTLEACNSRLQGFVMVENQHEQSEGIVGHYEDQPGNATEDYVQAHIPCKRPLGHRQPSSIPFRKRCQKFNPAMFKRR